MKVKDGWQDVRCELRKRTAGDKRWVLNYRKSKKGKPDEWLALQKWAFKKKNQSQIPPFFWTPLLVQLKRYVQRVPTNCKTYKTLRPEAIEAIVAAGKNLHFKVRTNRSNGDVVWYCSGHRLAVFLVADMFKFAINKKWQLVAEDLRDLDSDSGHRFREMERHSRALLRIAYVVGKGGFCKLVPGELGPAKKGN